MNGPTCVPVYTIRKEILVVQTFPNKQTNKILFIFFSFFFRRHVRTASSGTPVRRCRALSVHASIPVASSNTKGGRGGGGGMPHHQTALYSTPCRRIFTTKKCVFEQKYIFLNDTACQNKAQTAREVLGGGGGQLPTRPLALYFDTRAPTPKNNRGKQNKKERKKNKRKTTNTKNVYMKKVPLDFPRLTSLLKLNFDVAHY